MENLQMVQDILELTAIPVASRNERAIADVLRKKLEILGLDVEEDHAGALIGGNTGNLHAILKGDPAIPAILFSSHMDRVANNGNITPVWNKEEHKIYADGKTILAADDVSGICIILEALRNVQNYHLPHGDIEVVLSVCEEDGVLGSRHFDFSRCSAKMAFVFDAPGKAGRIIGQAPSKGRITFDIQGRQAHAGNEPEKGLNALHVAADLLMHLPDGRITPETTCNFSILHAGTSTNVVCGHVELIGELRSTNAHEYEALCQKMKTTADAIAQKYATTITASIHTLYHTFKLEPEEPVVRIAMNAFKNLGIDTSLERGGGGMDANHFNAHKIAAIGIACGYAKNHTPEENLSIDDFINCGEAATEFIKVTAAGNY